MSVTPLSSQSAQPILVPQSVKRSDASIGQGAVSEKTEANNDTTQAPSNFTSAASSNTNANGVNLNDPEVVKVLSQLKARDQEVRIHEQAHAAVGGQYVTSGPSYSYQTGPDGKRYAVGGNVGIDVSPVANDPKATLIKARQVFQAAMAPAEPSSQDYAVAQSAQAMMQQAQQEIATQQQVSMTGETDDESETSKSTQPTQNDNQRAASRFEQGASRFYEQTELATNGLVGRVGGYQDSALRLGLRLQA
ncbi:MAG: hypothetical protein KAZ85_02250 [Gammaproteobacteria bacterium]|nr:hypothetical protein [Gammaproteobacteria bacterium]